MPPTVETCFFVLQCDIASMNLLQTRIYYEHEFITSTDVLRARIYYEHEAQVQVNHDDKGGRFGAIITSYVERFLFQESTPYRKESSVPQRPWNVRRNEEDSNEEEGRCWIYLEPTPGVVKTIVFIHIVYCLIACLFLNIFIQVLLFVVIVFLLLVFTSCLYVFMKIMISGACVFPPPPFCGAAD